MMPPGLCDLSGSSCKVNVRPGKGIDPARLLSYSYISGIWRQSDADSRVETLGRSSQCGLIRASIEWPARSMTAAGRGAWWELLGRNLLACADRRTAVGLLHCASGEKRWHSSDLACMKGAIMGRLGRWVLIAIVLLMGLGLPTPAPAAAAPVTLNLSAPARAATSRPAPSARRMRPGRSSRSAPTPTPATSSSAGPSTAPTPAGPTPASSSWTPATPSSPPSPPPSPSPTSPPAPPRPRPSARSARAA